ncbi:antitoxin VbhA family protein [Campylobacter lanienae]|uniref:antitoxin VbhA family protein n=1 Tax=Campylobacter lanienae TaxID=75658 RepID=UPI000BB4118B|nr:antitoxin VbhA family protein [Campylobacter lanienae]MDD5786797.1 antitoxin VbhA family protein [Campylobacter lanienae]
MRYPEVYSLKESLAILDKYKDDLTKEQYEVIRSNIGSFAIEGMFLNQRNIIDNIKILKGEITADEIIAEYKKEWKIS